MARILTISGSPSSSSKTAALLVDVARVLQAEGHHVRSLNVRDLPAEDLLHARVESPAIVAAIAEVQEAEGIVIGTPIYKAAYTGILKAFLDLLPQFALEKKTVLPVATGGTIAHVLALDYGLRPVLSSLGARHIVGSHFVLDKTLHVTASGALEVDGDTRPKYLAAIEAFADSLHRHAGESTRRSL
jgi:FMN reductase